MFRRIERVASWLAGYRVHLWVLLMLAVAGVLIVTLLPDAIDRAAESSPLAVAIGYVAFFGILGFGSLAGHALHVVHWFGPGRGESSHPLIYRMYPHARAGIVAFVALGFVPPLGTLFLLIYFLATAPW